MIRRRLFAPRITEETICQRIACVRPTRPGCFTLVCEQIGKKEVINCSGHGGSGWTTLFGYIEQALSVVPPKKRVRIIGSGCMGLTAAIELVRQGYEVAGITTKSLYDSASWRAAGYFALIKIETTPLEQKIAHEMGVKTFLTFRAIEEGKHPYLTSSCVRFLSVFCNQKMMTGVEQLEKMGLIPPAKQVTLDFGNGVEHPHYLEYKTYFMNTSRIMQELLNVVRSLRIPIEVRALDSYEEVAEEVIVNCSGMGAQKLHNDPLMVGVRGHLVMLNDLSDPRHTEYMIYTTVEQEGKEEYLYMFPKNFYVTPQMPEGRASTVTLGGTFCLQHPLSEEEEKKQDEREWARLLARHQEFFYKNAKQL